MTQTKFGVIKIYWLPIIWVVFIFIMSVISGEKLPKAPLDIPHLDKLVHIVLYFILCYLFLRARKIQYSTFVKRFNKVAIIIGVTCLCYGVGLEILQEFLFKTRHFEWADITANGFGCFLAIIIFKFANDS